jgi:hypothetical protein
MPNLTAATVDWKLKLPASRALMTVHGLLRHAIIMLTVLVCAGGA